jgi:flavin reductase (DIM6/NTAB) family NADH-FMN oxidoreductase RutF
VSTRLALNASDHRVMREAMGQFPSGVTVVTTLTPAGVPAGCTVSAFTSLSLDPPLVLVAIGNNRRMARLLQIATGFVVNILRDDQAGTAVDFAGHRPDRFTDLEWFPCRNGIPKLAKTICRLECSRWAVQHGGDHLIVIGSVESIDLADGDPLVYLRGRFVNALDPLPGQPASPAPDDWLCSAPW